MTLSFLPITLYAVIVVAVVVGGGYPGPKTERDIGWEDAQPPLIRLLIIGNIIHSWTLSSDDGWPSCYYRNYMGSNYCCPCWMVLFYSLHYHPNKLFNFQWQEVPYILQALFHNISGTPFLVFYFAFLLYFEVSTIE